MTSTHNDQNRIIQLEKENLELVKQLHLTQEALEKYYLELRKTKTPTSSHDTKNPKQEKPLARDYLPIYGAAHRLKNELPYRLGHSVITKSNSLTNLAKLPFTLLTEYKDYKKQLPITENLPPLEQYQDYAETEKIKKHLSYRLGIILVDSIENPKNLIKLPKKTVTEITKFYKKR